MMLVAGPISSDPGPSHGSVATSSIGQYGDCNKRYAKLQEGLDSSISLEGKSRIERILNEIQLLTDVEKLLLYLKLPTGLPKDEHLRLSPPSCLPASNRKEQGEAMTWIKSHLEEHGDVCMPKAEVYDEYKHYCVQHELRPLCNADFGKVMKTVFPDINTRRLGQRGQSKYFYGGLRKKLEHSPPGLPELEIHSKTAEVDKNLADTEVFKASCKLVCEWADKLLDHKFNGVQAIAEHLVSSMYINTKSVAAFTLIAAMQETGNQHLKGSALFNSQTNSSMDKHKETNLLLQQKLHKNKVLQKQKEKLQTMKEENEQLQGSAPNLQSDNKTCNTPSRKSSTPSKMSRTPKLSSPSPSPVVVQQSPRKPTSSAGCTVAMGGIVSMATKMTSTKESSSGLTSGAHMSIKTSQDLRFSMAQSVSSAFQKPLSCNSDVVMAPKKMEEYRSSGNVAVSNSDSVSSDDVIMLDDGPEEMDERKSVGLTSESVVILMKDTKTFVGNSDTYSVDDVKILTGARPKSSRETPYTEMEVNSNMFSHVRKISFENVGDSLEHDLDRSRSNEQSANSGDLSHKSTDIEMLSKSAGHLSLKMLLERKDDNQSSLNKSTGLLEKSKNTLLVNQSNIAGRSAFVPFAQVQQPRRDPGEVIQTSSAISIPITIPASTEKSTHLSETANSEKNSQSTNITMVTVPHGDKGSGISELYQTAQRLPDNIIKIFPGAAAVQLSSSSGEKVSLAFPISESLALSSSAKNLTKDSLTILTSSTSLAMCSGAETSVSATQNSPGISKHSRTRFTPIRPKGSPNKATASKDSKVDNPVYDKRPVSEILKEKRAKEQAEAIAKIQAGINLPTIPFQPSISLNSGNFGGFQQLQGVGGNKEVVIIVNNQPGGNLSSLVNQTSLLTQPVLATRQGKGPEDDGIRMKRGDQTTNMNMNTPPKQDHIIGGKVMKDSQDADCLHSHTEGMVRGQRLHGEGQRQGHLDFTDMHKDMDRGQRLQAEVQGQLDFDMYKDMDIDQRLKGECQGRGHVDFTDMKPASAGSEMEVEMEDVINVDTPVEQRNTVMDATAYITEQERNDKFEQIYTETPAKIAKLNITSPYRPDSACSLGRETPLRLAKQQEPCSSRPESACSFGRETPSGARKRKSSDYQQRKDFKRLNSTGDEGDDMGLAELLSPGLEGQGHSAIDPHRRTQSCTFELDREVRRGLNTHPVKTVTMNLLEGLQSPDIVSLEEEALNDSFPNSLYVMRPHHKSQRHSVGVGARTVKVYQQRLLKQKQDLDKQVGTFLQQKQSKCESSPQSPSSVHDGNKGQSDFKVPFKNPEVVKDSGRDVGNVFVSSSQGTGLPSGRSARIENEPSELPSDIADWINETMEKRQTQNQSVLSEPELGDLNPQRASTAIDFTAPSFNFEVDHAVRARSSMSSRGTHDKKSTKDRETSSKAAKDDTFTVPKVPSLTLRVKELPNRSTETSNQSQRCQSLPMFNSASKSPVSPISVQMTKHPLYQRAVSMSPKQQPDGQPGQVSMLSPVSGLTSPLRRIEVRDNHPISVSVHSMMSVTPSSVAKTRDETYMKFTNYSAVGKQNPTPLDDSRNQQVGPYLASIQYNLQKPKDISTQEVDHSKSREISFIVPSTKFIAGSKTLATTSSQSFSQSNPVPNQANGSQEGQGQVNLAQFSDSGYQSSGPSPVLNSTPVSGNSDNEMGRLKHTGVGMVSQSPVAMTMSVQQAMQVSTPKMQMSFPDVGSQLDVKQGQTIISSSTNSAFIPIQSSNQTVQFVTPTPIRPTVSLPNQIYQIPTSSGNLSNQSGLFIDPNQSSVSQDVPMTSPKGHDPPPYETAVKALRQSNLNIDSWNSTQDKNRITDYNVEQYLGIPIENSVVKDEAGTFEKERVSLLANMGKEYRTMDNKESFGPFASKLVQLSRQTKTSTLKPNTSPVRGVMTSVTSGTSTSQVLYRAVEGQGVQNTMIHSGDGSPDVAATNSIDMAVQSELGQKFITSPNSRMFGQSHVTMVDSGGGSGKVSDNHLHTSVSFNQSFLDLVGNNQSNLLIQNENIQSNPLSLVEGDGQSNLLIQNSRDRNDFEQINHGATKGLLSPNSEQNLSAFTMDIDFLPSPSNPHSLLHLNSPPSRHDNVLFSTDPSIHQSAIGEGQSDYKDISDSEISSFILQSHTPANLNKESIHVTSNVPNKLTEDSLLLQQAGCSSASDMQMRLEKEMNVDKQEQIQIKEHFTDLVRRQNSMQAVLDRPEAVMVNVGGLAQLLQKQSTTEVGAGLDPQGELTEDLDLMLQDLENLEQDLL